MNSITGRVLEILPAKEFTTRSGNPFKRQEIVIDTSRHDVTTGQTVFASTPVIEFTNDRCNDLSIAKVGDLVTIEFDLKGVKYTAKDGSTRYFTAVQGYRLTKPLNTAKTPQNTPTVHPKMGTNDVFPQPKNTVDEISAQQKPVQATLGGGFNEVPKTMPDMVDDLPF